MATLFVDKVDPQSGTSLEIGSSGDTITIPSSSPIGTAVRVTCLASGGSNAAELWLVEAFSDNIAITNT